MPQFTEMRRPVLWDENRLRSTDDGGSAPALVPPRTVVLGYDGSEDARSAALRAVEAAGSGGRILVVGEGDPVDALVAAASETNADLIVVGARGRSFPARALRGSVAQRLVARAPCPVLVAR